MDRAVLHHVFRLDAGLLEQLELELLLVRLDDDLIRGDLGGPLYVFPDVLGNLVRLEAVLNREPYDELIARELVPGDFLVEDALKLVDARGVPDRRYQLHQRDSRALELGEVFLRAHYRRVHYRVGESAVLAALPPHSAGDEVTGVVSQEACPAPVDVAEHQDAGLPVRDGLVSLRVQDLPVEVLRVEVDVRVLVALVESDLHLGHAVALHQPEVVASTGSHHQALDVLSQRVGEGLGRAQGDEQLFERLDLSGLHHVSRLPEPVDQVGRDGDERPEAAFLEEVYLALGRHHVPPEGVEAAGGAEPLSHEHLEEGQVRRSREDVERAYVPGEIFSRPEGGSRFRYRAVQVTVGVDGRRRVAGRARGGVKMDGIPFVCYSPSDFRIGETFLVVGAVEVRVVAGVVENALGHVLGEELAPDAVRVVERITAGQLRLDDERDGVGAVIVFVRNGYLRKV